jgi:hypothetical protein
MAEWFRSAEMKYVSLLVNEDAAHSCVNDLGLLGVIQFIDVSHGIACRDVVDLLLSPRRTCGNSEERSAAGLMYYAALNKC